MDRSERMQLIKAAARGDAPAIAFWVKQFERLTRFQCAKARIPYDDEITSMVRIIVWTSAQRYEFSERTGWGNTWVEYLRRSITNRLMDAGAARARRKESPVEAIPEQEASDTPTGSPSHILALQWQDYALELTDLECDQYARVRRREHSAQLFEDYEGQFSASFLANDGFTLIRFFETDERPTWPRFAKAHRLSRQGVEMLMFHLRQALDAVPLDVL